MSEDVARRELEDLLARDVSDGDPMVAWALQDKHSIRGGVRGGAPGVGKSRALFREWQHLDDCRKLYLSHSHQFLREQAERLSEKTFLIATSGTGQIRSKPTAAHLSFANRTSPGLLR